MRTNSLRRPALAAAAPLLPLAALLFLLPGCGGGDDTYNPSFVRVTGTASPTPTATPSSTPSPTPTPTPSQSPLTLTINPTAVTLALGGSQTFTANVTGSENTAVTWSIVDDDGMGTINQEGVYTASQIPGTYTVVVTSQADQSVRATATVTVQRNDVAPGALEGSID
jgi:hypothetical protein